MRNLLAFLIRNKIFILFLILEAFAFSWIISSRSFQRASFVNSSNAVSGSISRSFSNLTRYLDLDEQNEQLSKENARLHSLLKSSYLPTTKNTRSVEDTIYQLRYSFMNANIIAGTYGKTRNYINLDRGRKHGLYEEMGVIGPKGIVGKVQALSNNFATVVPVINPLFQTTGMILNSREAGEKAVFGPIDWDGSDYSVVQLSDIPRSAVINTGDTVVTHRSRIFPEGIMIGTIEDYKLQEDQNFYRLNIRLSTDFSTLQQVYVITDKMKLELDSLQSANEANFE